MDLLLLVTVFVTAIITSAAVTPLVLRLANTYGLYDIPDAAKDLGRKVHSTPIPRLGGISILLSFLVCFFAWKTRTVVTPNLLLASILVFAIGIIDDLFSLSARLRFLLQILIASFAVIGADLVVRNITLYPDATFTMPWWLGFAFSSFVIVGAINSLNMIDGLDGLAGGVSIISLTLLSYVYYLLTQDLTKVVYFGLPIIGAVIGFLRYNTHPASIFMGDSGSNWLGFIIGAQLLMVLKAASAGNLIFPGFEAYPTSVSVASILMCFAIPVLDTALVIITRIRAGLPPMAADQRHFHHSLMHIGLSQSQSVTAIYFACLLAGIMGLAPVLYPRYGLQWVPYLGMLLVFLVMVLALSLHSRLRSRLIRVTRYYTRKTQKDGPAYKSLIRSWERLNKYSLFVVLAATPIFAGAIPASFGFVALPVLILLLSTVVLRSQSNDFFESLTIALACLTLLAANNHNELKVEILKQTFLLQPFYNGLFMFILLSSLGFLIVTLRRKHLILSASDFLIVTFPLLLNLLPDTIRLEYHVDIISIRTLIIFLCYRTLEKRRIQARRHIKMATIIALSYLVAASFLELKIVY